VSRKRSRNRVSQLDCFPFETCSSLLPAQLNQLNMSSSRLVPLDALESRRSLTGEFLQETQANKRKRPRPPATKPKFVSLHCIRYFYEMFLKLLNSKLHCARCGAFYESEKSHRGLCGRQELPCTFPPLTPGALSETIVLHRQGTHFVCPRCLKRLKKDRAMKVRRRLAI
jgi:uncharacterized C2H2 Zn-finger protein